METMAACDKHVKDLNSTVKSLEEKEKQVHGDYRGLQGIKGDYRELLVMIGD